MKCYGFYLALTIPQLPLPPPPPKQPPPRQFGKSRFWLAGRWPVVIELVRIITVIRLVLTHSDTFDIGTGRTSGYKPVWHSPLRDEYRTLSSLCKIMLLSHCQFASKFSQTKQIFMVFRLYGMDKGRKRKKKNDFNRNCQGMAFKGTILSSFGSWIYGS